MITWNEILDRFRNLADESYKSRSYYKSLVKIFNKAEEWGIDPVCAEYVSNSNMYEIIYEAKLAIANDQVDRLKELFKMASELKTSELRIWLRGDKRDEILVSRIDTDEKERYQMAVTKDQLETIKNATAFTLNFIITEVEK